LLLNQTRQYLICSTITLKGIPTDYFMKLSGFILSLIICLTSYIVYGQNKISSFKRRSPVRTINFEKGLLNNSTTDIITDVFGFTWVSTKTGLQRFNGYALETITPVVNKDTFNINYPVIFFGLKNGFIWISFKEGILEYNPDLNSFRLLISYRSPTHLHFPIIPLKETQNSIWCMRENKGIVIYDKEGNLNQKYSFFDSTIINDIIKSRETFYSNLVADNDNYIFIYSNTNKRILSINFINKSFGYINTEGANLLSIACNDDHLYILSDSLGLLKNLMILT